MNLVSLSVGAVESARAMELAKKNSYVPKDNAPFIAKYRPDRLPEAKPTKDIILSQDPEAGSYVPAGSKVNVTFIAKSTIPVETFEVEKEVADKYKGRKMEDFLADIEEAEATKTVLEKEKNYKELKPEEKKLVDTYLEETYAVKPSGTEAEIAKFENIYKDVQFLLTF